MDTNMEPPTPQQRVQNADLLSSSPAFATPAHPVLPRNRPTIPRGSGPFPRPATTTFDASPPSSPAPRAAPVLSIILPSATLRPIAFRTFTKKHNLTLTSSALQALASFIGRHCGSRWREDGLAEAVLEEVARSWKKGDGKVIVDADGDRLKGILKQLEGAMVGGRITVGGSGKGLSRESSATSEMLERISSGLGRAALEQDDSQGSFMNGVDEQDDEIDDEGSKQVRGWLKVVSAFEQPRLAYNPNRKHFEKSKTNASLLPSISQRTELFRQRYHLMHQRLLRNESFQASTTGRDAARAQQAWKVTPIANLLGRSGTGHLLLGLLHAAPTGQLAISDLSGSIILDLEQATPIDAVETWISPGMIVLIDGIYEEEYGMGSGSLSGAGGIGGTISGRFVGFSIGAPRCETRAQSLGLSDAMGADSGTIGGGFGWVDFLGVGSDRAVGARMRRIEQKLLAKQPAVEQATLLDASRKMIVLGQLALDDPKTITTLRKILNTYTSAAQDLASDSHSSQASVLPTGFILFGSFLSQPALSSPAAHANSQETQDSSSIAYKEAFDILAALLHEFALLLRHCSFVFVPGDKDAWASSFSAGASVTVPQSHVPDMFTTRVKREFASANAETSARDKETRGAHENMPGQAIWTSNPSRISLFGPAHEMVLFRDDASGRLRRNAVTLKKQVDQEQDHHSDSGISMSGEAASSPAQVPAPVEDAMEVDGDAEDNQVQVQETRAQQKESVDPKLQHARRLTKTLLDQTHLSPYPLSSRPVHWSYAHALSLYPLPSALVLCDTDAEAFSLVYQGCCVVNAGRLVSPVGGGSSRDKASWVEYDLVSRRGLVRDMVL